MLEELETKQQVEGPSKSHAVKPACLRTTGEPGIQTKTLKEMHGTGCHRRCELRTHFSHKMKTFP